MCQVPQSFPHPANWPHRPTPLLLKFWVHSAPLTPPCTLEMEAVTGDTLTLTTPDPYSDQDLGRNFA